MPPLQRIPSNQTISETRTSVSTHRFKTGRDDENGSRVQSCLPVIKKRVNRTIAKTPFLQSNPPKENVASIGHFMRSEIRIGKKLGEGGYAEVYEIEAFDLCPETSSKYSKDMQTIRANFRRDAIDPSTGKCRYVIKHMRKSSLEKSRGEFATGVADMAAEASYLMRFKHANILSLRGLPSKGLASLEDGKHDSFFLILDRMTETLNERIVRWRSEEKQNKKTKILYSKQIASALEYLHSHRIVYRDIKPQNIGIDSNENIVLFDFGLCRQLSASLGASDAVYKLARAGTRRYMAPEVAAQAAYNCKADIYGWSLVVWQMFTLAKPFSAYNEQSHLKYVCIGNERPALNLLDSLKSLHEDIYFPVPKSIRAILVKTWDASHIKRPGMHSVCCELDCLLTRQTNKTPSRLSRLVSGNRKVRIVNV
jgi:serine/threonine protein kinase